MVVTNVKNLKKNVAQKLKGSAPVQQVLLHHVILTGIRATLVRSQKNVILVTDCNRAKWIDSFIVKIPRIFSRDLYSNFIFYDIIIHVVVCL
jgi:hypothetical protein